MCVECPPSTHALWSYGLGHRIGYHCHHRSLRGIWPLNTTTPFFAFMVLSADIGLLALAFAFWFGPDEHWRFAQGQVVITTSLRHQRHEFIITADEIDHHSITTIDSGDGPDTFGLVLNLKSPRVHAYVSSRPIENLKALLASFMPHKSSESAVIWSIKSPSFSTKDRAHQAYALLMRA